MSSRREHQIDRGAFLTAAAAYSSLLISQSALASAADPASVSLGTIPGDMTATVTYGMQLDYFKGAGIDLHPSILNSGPAIAAALVGGALDVGIINTGTLAAARSRGVPVKFFASCSVQSPGADLALVRKDSAIRTVADLSGKTIGIVALNTAQNAVCRKWIEKAGVDSKSVKFLEVPYPQMQAALEQGRVDATLPAEPFLTLARPTSRVLGDIDEAMPPGYLVFGFAATEAWLKSNGALAQNLATTIRRTSVWANSHKPESAQILVRTAGLNESLASQMVRAVYGTSLEPGQIQPVLDVMLQYGLLEKAINANDLIWHA